MPCVISVHSFALELVCDVFWNVFCECACVHKCAINGMAHQRVKALGLGDDRSNTMSERAPSGIRARWPPLRQGLLPCSRRRGRNAEQEVMRSTSSPNGTSRATRACASLRSIAAHIGVLRLVSVKEKCIRALLVLRLCVYLCGALAMRNCIITNRLLA